MKCQCEDINEHQMMIIQETMNDLVVMVQEVEGNWFLEGLNSRTIIPIKYCPICGRDLKEERWWE